MKNIKEKCLKKKIYPKYKPSSDMTESQKIKNKYTEMRQRDAPVIRRQQPWNKYFNCITVSSRSLYATLKGNSLQLYIFKMTNFMPRTKRKYGKNKLRLLSSKQENDGNISYIFFAKIGNMLQETQSN